MKQNQPYFDRIAPFYDFISEFVFGQSIFHAQIEFLKQIPQGGRVLVLGGGTGKFLPHLFRQNPECKVCYIDISAGMIARAKKRITGHFNIDSIRGTEENIPLDTKFDAVLTFFYLDLFESVALARNIALITSSLKENSIWLAADFVDAGDKRWRKIMLKTMYAFFAWTCGLTTRTLPDWKKQLTEAGFIRNVGKEFYDGFIESNVYRSRKRNTL